MTKIHSGGSIALGIMLKARFDPKHIEAVLEHYQAMISEFQKSEWEESIAKSGKLVEAALKALWVQVGKTVPRARDFKADYIIRELEKIPTANADDAIRLTIPRACRLVYDIASNRGARHDPDELDPNVMDASVVAPVCGWIIAELLRHAQKGMDPSNARDFVLKLTQKTFPNLEEVQGRTYFHLPKLSARTVVLLCLWRAHPDRVHEKELLESARRHGFTQANAKQGVSRLKRVTDDDGRRNLLLLYPGIAEAEKLMVGASLRPASGRARRHRF
jgi:hypothetical protein